ncbi:MAG: polyribonucleotide nucleotidyltransferase, partial [Pseudobdellovibrionaceae bacterium]
MKTTVTTSVGGKQITIETGRLAKQADGSVLVTCGNNMVLVTAVSSTKASPLDFFPLTVEYIEKFYATGKIPGGYFKREGRPTNDAILIARLIDRPIRPL